ncbi:hypothetical protein PQX77_010383 [Marasmius sp. AFHP31]|nr:hypothetical protein PQX77_010383 [Marasmius sp. AFHP31]
MTKSSRIASNARSPPRGSSNSYTPSPPSFQRPLSTSTRIEDRHDSFSLIPIAGEPLKPLPVPPESPQRLIYLAPTEKCYAPGETLPIAALLRRHKVYKLVIAPL